MTDTYGTELVTNGDFTDHASGWTNVGWDLTSAEQASLIALRSGLFSQSVTIESGYSYLIGFNAIVVGAPTRWGKLGGQLFNINNGATSGTVIAGSEDTLLQFYGLTGAGMGVAVDNISVKLIIPEGALVTDDTVGTVTVKFAVPLGHLPGDYAVLYSNNGSGAIDWNTPFSTRQIPLFPNAAGNYGFGMSPFGMSPFGLPAGKNLRRGFGTCPFGMSPFGLGAVVITERAKVSDCGSWIFAVKCFDKLGNAHTGTPSEVTAVVHVTPAAPAGLKKDSYDKATDILTLSVIDPYSKTSGGLGYPPSRLWPALTGGPYGGYSGGVTPPGGDTDDGAVDDGLPSRNS